MSDSVRTWSTDSNADAIRKRVCKACDRCRLKKSKCDGSNPCTRCKADNAICVFGERKKSHDKVYPKGYVEMLEQQQTQLVAGLQEMYRRLLQGQMWSGPQLSEATGFPLTHDILAALNLLEPKADSSGEMEEFEEDCQRLQAKLLAEGAPYMARRGSVSSESEHSQADGLRRDSSIAMSRAPTSMPPNLVGNISITPSPSPLTRSPIVPPPHLIAVPNAPQPQQLQSPLTADPQFYQAVWTPSYDLDAQTEMMRGKFLDESLLQDPTFTNSDAQWADADTIGLDPFDLNVYASQPYLPGLGPQISALDPMDLDLSRHSRLMT